MPPSASIDPSILRSLCLDASSTQITSYGSSGFSSTFRLTTTNPDSSIFVKTSGEYSTAATMFAGEHASLNAIHAVVPSLCPRSLAWGKLDDSGGKDAYFLATEFLDLSSSKKSSPGTGSGLSLAQKLAKLHTTPAPIPPGHTAPQFGFPVPTCCGSTPQDNTWTASWADFFANRRLLAILEHGERTNGPDAELRNLVERTAEHVVPRLLAPGHLGGAESVKPVIVHGDLWSGNCGRGSVLGRGPENGGASLEEVVFDPSACYAHSEYELGIMRMFGGFGGAFIKEYHSLVPKTEPVEEYEDRVKLYESYHHLNHWAIFGGGYKRGAVGILRALCRKYADEGGKSRVVAE
jgi:protein-ribulosamine 3-kinase